MLSKLFPVFFCTEGRWTSLSIWIIKGLLLSLYRCEVCTSWLVTPGINLLLFNTVSCRLGASAVHPTPICFSIQDLNVPGYSGVMESSASFILFVYWLWKAVDMYLLTVKSRDSRCCVTWTYWFKFPDISHCQAFSLRSKNISELL